MKAPLYFFVSLLAVAGANAAGRTEIPNAAQPQLCAANDGRVWLVYGRAGAAPTAAAHQHGGEKAPATAASRPAGDIFVARSDDAGATFGSAIKVASVPNLMLGMRRGPRIAAYGDRVTVTVNGDELFALTSVDGGKTWSEPVTINDVPTSTREGLHDLAGAADGRLFTTWLDLRNGAMELWGAASSDAGRTWGKNEQVYHSSDKSICECCHPTVLFDADGNLAVMWRNAVDGYRDMWMSTRAKGSAQFTPARKLGEGTWKLNACPMDGGKIVALGAGKFGSVWQRAGEVFFMPASGPEILLGKGKQPVAVANGANPLILWQEGNDLVLSRAPGAPPSKLASDSRFAVVVTLPGQQGNVVAYEQGAAKEKQPGLVIERL